MVAANKSDDRKPIPAPGIVHPKTNQIKTPAHKAVSNTPTVESRKPCNIIGFISENFVSIPPENRMIHKATVPMVWAM